MHPVRGNRRGQVCSRSAAFTLVEVIVVLLVVGVAAGMIVPRMGRSLTSRELREAAARFAATARTVRELAIARGQTFSLQIDLDRGGYGVTMPAGGQPGQVRMVQTSWLQAARWPSSVSRCVVQSQDGQTRASGIQSVKFNPDGTSDGATIRLIGADSGDAAVVMIYPHTGRALVADPDKPMPVSDQMDLGD